MPENLGLIRPELLLSTLLVLGKRIQERFPDSSLYQLCHNLQQVSRKNLDVLESIKNPLWIRRLSSFLVIGFLLAVGGIIFRFLFQLVNTESAKNSSEFLQGLDAAVNVIILLAMALWFFWNSEKKYKRKIILKSLHDLRSFAHLVDMLQLTKDPLPEKKHTRTKSSPIRNLNRIEVHRYLDYCTELLAILSSLAALHAWQSRDDQVLKAVNDLEALSLGLSQKIWLKLSMIRG